MSMAAAMLTGKTLVHGRTIWTRAVHESWRTFSESTEVEIGIHHPRYDIALMQEHFVLISEYERGKVLPARWVLVTSLASDNSRAGQCVNAMAETIEAKPSFREAEWRSAKADRTRAQARTRGTWIRLRGSGPRAGCAS
jgi:hypothetical protein